MTKPSTPLIPAAKAVLTAFGTHPIRAEHIAEDLIPALAAALRAAADQVEHHWDGMECVDHLQAIAAELEGHHG